MKPKLKDLLDLLNEMAPPLAAEDWDNSGLQVGDLEREVKKVVVSLDPTLDAVRESARRGAQVLLSHHPLIFKTVSSLNRERYPGNVVFKAISSGIALIAAHTNLDSIRGGLNDFLAQLLNIGAPEFLKRVDGEADAGLGRIGNLPKPLTLAHFVQNLKTALSAERVRVAGESDALVNRVALVGGSGGSMIPIASQMRADVLVTGDVTHHQALEARNLGLALIDAGHFCTEKAALALFADALEKLMKERRWDAQVEVYEEEQDPLHYE